MHAADWQIVVHTTPVGAKMQSKQKFIAQLLNCLCNFTYCINNIRILLIVSQYSNIFLDYFLRIWNRTETVNGEYVQMQGFIWTFV